MCKGRDYLLWVKPWVEVVKGVHKPWVEAVTRHASASRLLVPLVQLQQLAVGPSLWQCGLPLLPPAVGYRFCPHSGQPLVDIHDEVVLERTMQEVSGQSGDPIDSDHGSLNGRQNWAVVGILWSRWVATPKVAGVTAKRGP